MSDKLTNQFIGVVKKTLTERAETAMQFPKIEPFEHGRQVGTYQGLQLALELLENILRDDIEKELRS